MCVEMLDVCYLLVVVARGLGDAHGVREDARQALLVVVVLGVVILG